VVSTKFQSDVRAKGRLTVDDASSGIAIAIHCMVSPGGLVLIACTRQDYPTRVVFPASTAFGSSGLLGRIAEVADDMLGAESYVATGVGQPGNMRRVQLAPTAAQALERICAEFEDSGAHDTISRVQREVDETRDVMQGTIHQMLSNQEQLTSLQGKTDAIANQSQGFYRGARTTRRELQCQEYKGKLLCGAVAAFLFLIFFGGLFSGGDDDGVDGRQYVWHVPPSPPPPGAL